MKICFFGIYDPAYSRNAILLRGLRQIGVEVVECREDWRDSRRYRKLWRKLRALDNGYDYVYAAYPSPVPTVLARLASKKPVVSDAFYSMFDSVVNDRRKYPWWGFRAVRLLILDWLGVFFAHIVITDTEEHKKYWSRWWVIKKDKIHTVYLGIQDELFFPKAGPIIKKVGTLVHFHGTYIPLQGTDKIIEATNLVRDEQNIHFRLIGNGRDFPKAKKLVELYGLGNVEFMDRKVPLADLNGYLAEADIVLGIFGDREKTLRVIPNKVYEGLAAGRTLITMDTPAVREIFSDQDMLLVKGDSQSIADAIRRLVDDGSLRTALAKHGHETVSNYKPKDIARSLLRILSEYR